MNVLRVTQLVSVVVYGGLLLAAVRFRLRQRERAAEWLVVTFALLEAIVVLGAVLPPLGPLGPDLTRWSAERLGIDAAIAALMAFPYLLHRFARSFRERPSWFGRAVDLGFVAVVAWTFLLPSLPLPGQPEPAWFTAYRWCFVAWWAGLLMSVSVSLWSAGRGQPGVVRRRMRWMAGAALILNATLVGSSMGGHDEAGRPTMVAAVVTAVLGWLSAASFWMGFTPPAMLRRLWRAEDEAKLRFSEQGLVRAVDPRQAAQVIVAPAAALLGGQAATVSAPDGTVLASVGEPVASRSRSVVVGEHSRVEVERSPYTPVFGTDEETLLRSLAGHLDMALARIAAFEASEAARLDAQESAERLHQLVYGISHDLKNPLVTLMGFTGLLAQEAEGLSQEGRMFLSRIQASTGYMERLIEDLLQVSRVGRTDRDPTEVDLHELVDDIGTDIETRYPGVSVACLDDVTLRINPVRARQLLTNLIENAARHGGRDRLTVQVSARCRDDGFVDLFVTDDGVGIPPEYREKVFAIFERLEGFSTDSPGTGVGLTMCRRIAEDVSGSIEIVDSPVGTNVRVALPHAMLVEAKED